jgi:hypothetical protein
MIESNAVVQQVWQGIVPTTWQTIHGKRRSAFAVGCSAIFVTLVLLFILGVGSVVLIGFLHAGSVTPSDQPSTFFLNPAALGSSTIAGYPAAAVVGGAALAFALLVGIIAGLFAARDARDPDPLIVLLPDGFVEYVSHRKPIIGVPYAALADIDLRVRKSTTTSVNPATGVRTTSTSTRIWLDLRYRNGHTERWAPRANFGSRLGTCQIILKAYSRYEALQGRLHP